MMKKIAPRDIFNEANFFKNLAFLTQHMEMERLNGLGFFPFKHIMHKPDFLSIDPDDGGLVMSKDFIVDRNEFEHYELRRGMNSRQPFPLFLQKEYDEIPIFNENGTLDSDFLAMFEEGPTSPPPVSSTELFAYSVFLKNIGRLALNSIPGVDKYNSGFSFDEAQYSDDGLDIELNDNRIRLLNSDLICRNGESISFEMPNVTDPDNTWPLLYKNKEGELERVFTANGQYRKAFLDDMPTPKTPGEAQNEIVQRPQRRR